MVSNTLDYFASKYGLDLNQPSPISILPAEREEMAQCLYELSFFSGAEVGVLAGVHAETICQKNPIVKLYCIDPWRRADSYHDYNNRDLGHALEEAHQRLDPYKTVFMQMTSMEAVKQFKDGSLDFVYLDGAHDFLHIAEDICCWRKKIRPGGILFGHDYLDVLGGVRCVHVKTVVDAYAKVYQLNPWFILGAGKKSHKHKNLFEWMFIC